MPEPATVPEELERFLFDQLDTTIKLHATGTPKVFMETRAIADALLASPVMRRIQADAWVEGVRRFDEAAEHVLTNPYAEEESNV